MGEVRRRLMWVESMGVVVRRYVNFSHITYPSYFSCICSFFAATSLLFVNFL